MTVYVLLDENDLVTCVTRTSSASVPAGAYEVLGVGLAPWVPIGNQLGVENLAYREDLHGKMRSGVMLVDRPIGPHISVFGNEVSVGPCPVGTVIEIFDIIGSERMDKIVTSVADYTETFQFVDSGTYAIDVQPPIPALPSEQRIIVP